VTFILYIAAALAEIAGCFAFWAAFRLDKSLFWLIPGVAALVLFAAILSHVPLDTAGRAYAAYGGVYIAASLFWLWLIEKQQPDRWDATGVILCLIGAAIIVLGPRSA
jgi:small multidrug resistance family-3 protein